MKITVIGSGNVGGALGAGWAKRGHEVVYGVRDPSNPKLQAVLAAAPGSQAETIAEAAARGEVVVLATPWGAAARQAVEACGDFAGRPLLDCTNPLQRDLSGLEIGHTTSGGEQVQDWAPTAKVVKIFNSTGANNMANPDYGGQAATMFYCGDDEPAKEIAGRLATELGFDAIDAGPLRQARLLEPLALLWISLAFGGHGREMAFKLLKR